MATPEKYVIIIDNMPSISELISKLNIWLLVISSPAQYEIVDIRSITTMSTIFSTPFTYCILPITKNIRYSTMKNIELLFKVFSVIFLLFPPLNTFQLFYNSLTPHKNILFYIY